MTTNNDYILARWRDAITDPPPDGWKGHVSREWRNGTVYQYCTEYMTNPHSFEFQGERRVFYHVRPGDQWLDITDRPGVAREVCSCPIFIPGSVDINNRIIRSEVHHAEPYGQPPWRYCPWCGGTVWRAVTGVTPTEVTNG